MAGLGIGLVVGRGLCARSDSFFMWGMNRSPAGARSAADATVGRPGLRCGIPGVDGGCAALGLDPEAREKCTGLSVYQSVIWVDQEERKYLEYRCCNPHPTRNVKWDREHNPAPLDHKANPPRTTLSICQLTTLLIGGHPFSFHNAHQVKG
jgi:hypothetical protein